MVAYIEQVTVPYMNSEREWLGLPSNQSGSVILDEFNRQTTRKVLTLFHESDLMYVIVSPNCTDYLQP